MANIGGFFLDIIATGLTKKIDLVNQALDHFHQAQQLLEQASRISVEISVEDGVQIPET